ADTRGRTDRPLEAARQTRIVLGRIAGRRGAIVRAGPHVEQHGALPAPGPLLLPHHQRARPRRRPPVDLAEVVAYAVLARRLVVGAVRADRVAAGVVAELVRSGWLGC